MPISTEALLECARELGADGTVFSSHAVIRKLTLRRPREYIDLLREHQGAENPFRTAHSSIGRQLAQLSELEKLGRVVDENIRGDDTENQAWRLRSAT